ncbi:hypothetical protein A3D88_03330 [Candidatus Peribacteria bacterium RIFCSPHIGHO2_02_FULL_52_16]|nr:MAG: hypothetical protein A2706_04150 [Candidatus Peribacteria bacterium RIFCSPHIGHO2_01_FULL_51_35]OGJ61362.1 MAG: hypothetical protein A3D88_03330 [Candidatus Peribacteria bacterium RIFCSPHIGHO2_02_FULL_52_16]
MEKRKSIIILDFGGQYAHLIGNRVRRLGAFSEILPPETPAETLKYAAGIILSGGPQSVYDKGSPQADPKILELGIPVLGLCYGLHWMTQALGGEVRPGHVKEYGRTRIETVNHGGSILQDCGDSCVVWMSHGDEAATLPPGFTLIATSDACKNAAFENTNKHLYALQFHPEVTHSEHGTDILKRFVDLCKPDPWSIESYAKHVGEEVKQDAKDKKVFMLVSGGVDSTVAFTLLNQVLGADRVQGLLVDTGLMRKNEVKLIKEAFDRLGIKNLRVEDASKEFFAALEGVYEPEQKRKAIGNTFLEVQRRVFQEMGLAESREQKAESNWLLGQGTIYPDTIETGGTKHADHIKTHHNRVEAVQKMIDAGLVIEPLKDLYKDEVRKLGEELGLPHELVWRHPFPGPGLGVRILCTQEEQRAESREQKVESGSFSNVILPIKSVGVQGDGRSYKHALVLFGNIEELDKKAAWELATDIPNKNKEINRVLFCTSHTTPVPFSVTPFTITRARADLLREADSIVHDAMVERGLYEKIWQFPVVLLPIGVEPGHEAIVLRPVDSTEAMTANATRLDQRFLETVTQQLMKLPGIDLVFYDLTSKPPGTIEWE